MNPSWKRRCRKDCSIHQSLLTYTVDNHLSESVLYKNNMFCTLRWNNMLISIGSVVWISGLDIRKQRLNHKVTVRADNEADKMTGATCKTARKTNDSCRSVRGGEVTAEGHRHRSRIICDHSVRITINTHINLPSPRWSCTVNCNSCTSSLTSHQRVRQSHRVRRCTVPYWL